MVVSEPRGRLSVVALFGLRHDGSLFPRKMAAAITARHSNRLKHVLRREVLLVIHRKRGVDRSPINPIASGKRLQRSFPELPLPFPNSVLPAVDQKAFVLQFVPLRNVETEAGLSHGIL